MPILQKAQEENSFCPSTPYVDLSQKRTVGVTIVPTPIVKRDLSRIRFRGTLHVAVWERVSVSYNEFPPWMYLGHFPLSLLLGLSLQLDDIFHFQIYKMQQNGLHVLGVITGDRKQLFPTGLLACLLYHPVPRCHCPCTHFTPPHLPEVPSVPVLILCSASHTEI